MNFIRHLVLWKLDDSYSPDEKAEILKKMKDLLMGLEGKIDELKEISVQFNHSDATEANYDIILGTLFESLDALNAYQVHPLHQEVVQYFKTLKLQRSAIDYEI